MNLRLESGKYSQIEGHLQEVLAIAYTLEHEGSKNEWKQLLSDALCTVQLDIVHTEEELNDKAS